MLLNFLPMAPGLVPQKPGSSLQDVLSTSELELAQQGYLFRCWFSHSIVYIWQQQQVHGRGKRSKRAKATSFSVLHSARWAAWFKCPGMTACVDHPSCPELWLHVALGQVFGSVFLFGPRLDSPLARDPRTIFPLNTGQCSGTYHELDKQWIQWTTVPAPTAQDREGNRYRTSPKQI